MIVRYIGEDRKSDIPDSYKLYCDCILGKEYEVVKVFIQFGQLVYGVIDESGESYVYSACLFEVID